MLVRIEHMAYGGSGIGADESGKECAVPFTLPGELVGSLQGDTASIIDGSEARVTPGCVHFGRCGGCHYQHAAYAAQVEIKRGILSGILAKALGPIPEIEVRTDKPWGYRNRVRMRVETTHGMVRVGYSRRRSNEFLAIMECPIAAPVLWKTASALEGLAEADDECRRWLQRTAEVEIFCSDDQTAVQLRLFLRQGPGSAAFAGFCSKVKELVPELAGAAAEMDAELGRKVRNAWSGASWGIPGLMYRATGRKYWVSRGAFFQVNRFLVDEMVRLVTDGAPARLAWDLYAGVGLFARALAAHVETVVAVEGNSLAAADLRQSGEKVRVIQAATVEFLRAAVLERDRPELVVMDPPRAGVGTEGCALLARIGAPVLLYVSCDPETLGRDLAVLTRSGYVADRVCLVDMFPQTFHIETVVRLLKRD